MRSGDRIWWDMHDWSQTDGVPAVVGSFPEPFLNGIEGKRLPVRVECATVAGCACRTVVARLRAVGVPAAVGAIERARERRRRCGCSSGRGRASRSSRPHGDLDRTRPARERRVRPLLAPAERRWRCSTATGRRPRTLRAGAGLSPRPVSGEEPPVWLVTGTDGQSAWSSPRDAFDQGTLHDRFALALSPAGGPAARGPTPSR